MSFINEYKVHIRRFAKQVVKQGLALFRMPTGRIRLLPDFIITGAQKCGTTSLYYYLLNHPNVAPALYKEIRFFDINFNKGITWYRSHFPTFLYRAYFKKRYGQDIVVGEASPYYIFHPHAARRIREIAPRTKLILLLRNPVDRAYSHYQHKVRTRIETLSFEESIQVESERLNGEVEKMLEDEGYFSFNHYHYSYLARGIYVDQLKAWMHFFPREQILILKSEDFYRNPPKTFGQVLDFLGLSNWEIKEYKQHLATNYQALDAVTRKQLEDYFAPYNQKLCEYLDWDLGWEGET